MNKTDSVLSQSDAERREARESKPVRKWSAEERGESFLEFRKIEREKAEAGIVEEWELCEDCHEFKPERGFCWCKKCIEQRRQYED